MVRLQSQLKAQGCKVGWQLVTHLLQLIPNELAMAVYRSSDCIEMPGGLELGILLYADDIVLLAPTEGRMRNLIKLTESWMDKYKLNTNAAKSQAMLYGGKRKMKVMMQGQELKQISEYAYLGFVKGLRPSSANNQRIRALKMEIIHGVIGSFRSMELRKKLTMARACINTVGMYGMEATGAVNEEVHQTMERTQRRFARFQLGARKCVANESCY